VTEFIPVVNGYPGYRPGYSFDETTAVYVEKMNRIYFFGGITQIDTPYKAPEDAFLFEQKIWYINL
jgi:hypothetical protein